jgi:hypothetical protein
MLTVDIDEFIIELKDGSIRNVGASNKSGSVTLYDVTDLEAREFGNDRVKLAFADETGNGVEVAIDAADAEPLAADLREAARELES